MLAKSKIVAFILVVFALVALNKKGQAQRLPQLGAEIFIEPGQTEQEIDGWVKDLKNAGMPYARVFMLWNDIEATPGHWDFSLYDDLFQSAEKYGVKITVTLVPNQPPFFWGKPFFYYTHNMKMYGREKYRKAAESYIMKVVTRYRNSPSLDSWWLYNEPNGYPEVNEFAINSFQEWLKGRYPSIDSLNRDWHSYFDTFDSITYDDRWISSSNWIWQSAFYKWNIFWKGFINDQIAWLRREVEKYDGKHPFTTNPPGIFGALAHYDLIGMDSIVDIAGSSLHPSWSFSWLPRERFGLAVSWQNALLYGVTETSKPYWISELQGGSNWLGTHPMNPTPSEMAQWTWTSVGSVARRIIYWLLNSRMQGQESNEWSLLDFQNSPSDRMNAVRAIAENIHQNKGYFDEAVPVYSPVTIIVSPRTLLMQERKYSSSGNDIAAVRPLAHQKAAMAIYNAFMERGIPVRVKLFDSFNWQTDKQGLIVILPDIISLSDREMNDIKQFVAKGNSLMVSGLTGVYDENEKSWIVNRTFPLEGLLGGEIKDIFSDSARFEIKLDHIKGTLPCQLIYSEVLPKKGEVIGKHKGKAVALMNTYEKGHTWWIPSMIGIGGWVYGDKPLSDFLIQEIGINNIAENVPVRFDGYYENCFMHILKGKNGYITIVSNGGSRTQSIHMLSPGLESPMILYGNKWDGNKHQLTLRSGQTSVLYWE